MNTEVMSPPPVKPPVVGLAMEWSDNIREIGDQIAALTPEKATSLLAYLKETYNIDAPESLVPRQEPPKEEVKPQEQTEFAVVLESFDMAKKITLVKCYREITAAALKDAMEAINNLPRVIKEGLAKADAEKLKSLLEECGGKASLK